MKKRLYEAEIYSLKEKKKPLKKHSILQKKYVKILQNNMLTKLNVFIEKSCNDSDIDYNKTDIIMAFL